MKNKPEQPPLSPVHALAQRAGQMDRRELLNELRRTLVKEMEAMIAEDLDPERRARMTANVQRVDAIFTVVNTIVDALLKEYGEAVVRAVEEKYRLTDFLTETVQWRDAMRAQVHAVADRVGAAKIGVEGVFE